MAMNFSTANQTFRQLLGNGLTYSIPRFQRDYSWTRDEWDDLWQDIQGTLAIDGEPAHYMGYLVLQTQDNKNFEVIDGQQRLTTLSLLVLAVLKTLQGFVDSGIDADNNRRRLEQLRSSYIGYLDPVTLIPQSKLSLNRNNDAYYKDYIVPLLQLPQRNLRASEHNLRKAFQWLLDEIRNAYAGERDGRRLAAFVESIVDRLFFTVIVVTDELNAFKVFETLNSRGVRLSPTDLLKNYLFSVVSRESSHAHEIETLERRWEAMVGRLGGESFPDFLRAHWNSREKFVREADLFKTIREGTGSKEKVFNLLRQMEQDIDTYAALANPEDELWNAEQREFIRGLRMFNVRQPWPLFLAAYRTYGDNDFTSILRVSSIISFRYNVIGGLATNEQERIYNSAAQKIAGGEMPLLADAIRALGGLYISDERFRAAFASKSLKTTAGRNRSVVRYILFELERHISGRQMDEGSGQYSIEHVLPENPGDNWPYISQEALDADIYRLGNMTLLEMGENRQLGNQSFSDKKSAYEISIFQLTRELAEKNTEWNAERIATRQKWMAAQATSIWRVNQFAQARTDNPA